MLRLFVLLVRLGSMVHEDARKLSPAAQHERRRQVVRANSSLGSSGSQGVNVRLANLSLLFAYMSAAGTLWKAPARRLRIDKASKRIVDTLTILHLYIRPMRDVVFLPRTETQSSSNRHSQPAQAKGIGTVADMLPR
jgi:hypothetical protein